MKWRLLTAWNCLRGRPVMYRMYIGPLDECVIDFERNKDAVIVQNHIQGWAGRR